MKICHNGGTYMKKRLPSKTEVILLLFLSVVAIVLGVLILTNVLTIRSDVFLISKHPMAFTMILIGVGVGGLVLSFIQIKRIRGN